MTINLWPQQDDLNSRARNQLIAGKKSVLIQAATGFGKTRCAAAQIEGSQIKRKRSMFVVPRRQLLQQTSEGFEALGVKHSFIAAGKSYNPHAQTWLCTVGTLHNRMRTLEIPDVIFIDECHFGEGQLGTIISFYKQHGCYIIGLSATPWKANGKGLGCWFDAMVCGEQVSWLIEQGYLSDYKAFAPDAPDLTGIGKSNGEYNQKQLSAQMEKERIITGNAVRQYIKTAHGKRNITFCTSIKHSQMTAEAFNQAGIRSMHVDGETDKAELRRIIIMFARGEILNLCCAQLLQFGFDLSQASGMDDVTVESMTDLDPTMSLAKQMQKWGRVLRRKETIAIINDHAGNIQEHGLPDQDREWTLEDRKKKSRASTEEKAEVVRDCPKCFRSHKPAPACPQCGHIYEIQAREVEHVDGELKELDKDAIKRSKQQEQGMAQTVRDLILLGRERKYKNDKWAANIYCGRHGRPTALKDLSKFAVDNMGMNKDQGMTWAIRQLEKPRRR